MSVPTSVLLDDRGVLGGSRLFCRLFGISRIYLCHSCLEAYTGLELMSYEPKTENRLVHMEHGVTDILCICSAITVGLFFFTKKTSAAPTHPTSFLP